MPVQNENFLRGRRDLLKDIHRRKPSASPGGSAAGMPGMSIMAANGAIEVGHEGVALISKWMGCATTRFLPLQLS